MGWIWKRRKAERKILMENKSMKIGWKVSIV
jgi:hypothetical protein